MKKRLFSIILILCMVLTLLPTIAAAQDTAETPILIASYTQNSNTYYLYSDGEFLSGISGKIDLSYDSQVGYKLTFKNFGLDNTCSALTIHTDATIYIEQYSYNNTLHNGLTCEENLTMTGAEGTYHYLTSNGAITVEGNFTMTSGMLKAEPPLAFTVGGNAAISAGNLTCGLLKVGGNLSVSKVGSLSCGGMDVKGTLTFDSSGDLVCEGDAVLGNLVQRYGVFKMCNASATKFYKLHIEGNADISSDYLAQLICGNLTVGGKLTLDKGDYLAVNGAAEVGSLEIRSGSMQIYTYVSSRTYHPFTVNNNLTILDGELPTGQTAVKGDFTISGGEITATGDEKGLIVDGNITIADGTVIREGEDAVSAEVVPKFTGSTKYVSIVVAPAAPSITTQPADTTVTEGRRATFSVTATGNPAPAYKWQLSTDEGATWSDIGGATSESYTTAETTIEMSGWKYRCIVSNSAGNETSDAATLTVKKPPIIDPDPPGGGGGGTPTTPTPPPVTPPDTWKNPFTDVGEKDWFYGAVKYCNENGLMDGVSATEFKPTGIVSRAEVWQVLANLAGVKTDTTKAPWYTDAQAWAVSVGITDGTEPTGEVTREQLVTMLYRYYTQIAKGEFAGGMSAKEFEDFADVSQWAQLAVQWGVSDGIIQGSDNRLNPTGGASRAELAAMLMRFDKLLKA